MTMIVSIGPDDTLKDNCLVLLSQYFVVLTGCWLLSFEVYRHSLTYTIQSYAVSDLVNLKKIIRKKGTGN